MTLRPRALILCTSPRSGSTLLCRLLETTDVCGVPESYFHTPSLADWLKDYDLADQSFTSEVTALRAVFDVAYQEGQSSNGVFALRLQRHSAPFFFEQLTCLRPVETSDHARLAAEFGPLLYVWLSRGNKLDQAISYLIAQQSGLWHRAPDGTEIERLSGHREPVYDRAAIIAQIAEFERYDSEWQAWFAAQGLSPLKMSYEALALNPLKALSDVLTAMGQDPEHSQKVTVPVAKLADERNADWAARYRAGQ